MFWAASRGQEFTELWCYTGCIVAYTVHPADRVCICMGSSRTAPGRVLHALRSPNILCVDTLTSIPRGIYTQARASRHKLYTSNIRTIYMEVYICIYICSRDTARCRTRPVACQARVIRARGYRYSTEKNGRRRCLANLKKSEVEAWRRRSRPS